MKRSKYNVSSDASTRTFDGITFDSAMEMRYFRDVVLPLVKSGEIVYYERQKKYQLQPPCLYYGERIRPIDYVADFYLRYSDGRAEVIDVKGYPDAVAKLKRKMFAFYYSDVRYRWITYCAKWGGWIDYDELQRKRKAAKKKSL